MAFKIKWSDEASFEFEQIIDFIKNRWTEKEAIDFVSKVESVIEAISIQPYIYPESNLTSVRKAVVTTQTSFYYLIREQEIFLITFWDNRKNPVSNPF